MNQAVETGECCRAVVEGSKVDSWDFVPPVVASSSTPHAPSPSLLPIFLASTCDRQLPPRPTCSVLSVPVPVLFPIECSRVPSRRAVQCSAALKFKCGADPPPPKILVPACGALHTLHFLSETRLTVQSNSSPRDADFSGERRSAGMRRDVFFFFFGEDAGFVLLFCSCGRTFVCGADRIGTGLGNM